MLRGYLVALAAGFLAAAAAWYGLVGFVTGVPTPSSEHNYELVRKKLAITGAIEGRKVIATAGSSAQYGISAKLIQERLGIPAVNMGVAAGIGLDHLLRITRQAARPGDVVILAPEYVLLADAGLPDETKVDYVFARDPAYLAEIGLVQRMQLVYAMPPARLWAGIEGRLHGAQGGPAGPYRVETMNANGDETRNRLENRTPRALWQLQSSTPDALSAIHLRQGEPIRLLTEFRDWCRKNGVTLLATFPSTLHFAEYDTPAAQRGLERLIEVYGELGIPVMGTPREFMYGIESFYDTRYHLHSEAMMARTGRLIQLLRPHLETAGIPVRPEEAGLETLGEAEGP